MGFSSWQEEDRRWMETDSGFAEDDREAIRQWIGGGEAAAWGESIDSSWNRQQRVLESLDGLRLLLEQVALREDLPAAPPPPYGGYDLQRDDRDSIRRYGGSTRSAARGEALPVPGATPFVTQLQSDLSELGFRVVGPANGTFARPVEWAVREFQAYAKMDFVAQEVPVTATSPTRYVDRLIQVANAHPYRGPVSGLANADTRRLLQHWLANRWRCPLVIEAWNMSGGARTSLQAENLWLHNDVPAAASRMYARDFSNYYSFSPGRSPSDLIVVGDHVNYLSWDGPRSNPPAHTWSDAELLPENLLGVELSSLSASERSTYKVVRAVSEVECLGFFDSLNAYDNAFVSLGPCHWTLGIVGAHVEEGELCGYLAYLRHADPVAFHKAFEFFGARVDESWVDAGMPNGRNLFRDASRKYAGWVAFQREDGSFARIPLAEADGNYFKTWHWFYRFAMAGRTVEGFRRRMWHMARVRVRDIRATPWGAGVTPVPDGHGGTRPTTIGDVYTSERAIAMILRWHIRFPASIVNQGHAGGPIRAAFARAAIAASAGDPTAWTDAHETSLIQGIREEVAATGPSGFIDSMNAVSAWPRWAAGSNPRGYRLDPTIGNLSVTRNCFQFDERDLPPAPY
jgi:Putative peptidoglycan binding domain